MVQKMKKSVSELKKDVSSANRQIKAAKESGNKRQLNLGRQRRIAAWRELRDEHGMKPPAHIAKALGESKKKETPEFRKPREEKPKKDVVIVSETEMDFTRLPKKELDKLYAEAEVIATREERAAAKKKKLPLKAGVKTAPKRKKVQARTAPKVSSPKLRAEVRSWLNTFPEYAKLSAKTKEHERQAQIASKDVQELAAEGVKGERLKKALDKLFVNRHTANKTRREMEQIIEAHKKEFEDEHAYDPQLVGAYSDYENRFSNTTNLKIIDPFTTAENRLMTRVSYNYHRPERIQRAKVAPKKIKIKGKSQLQRELKKRLLQQAEELLESLPKTTAGEQQKNEETVEEIRKAASSVDVGYGEMLALAVGEEDSETMENLELAFLAETIGDLETRVAIAERKKKPVKIARDKRKRPRFARLEKKRNKKEV